jgi:hypothetical protein
LHALTASIVLLSVLIMCSVLLMPNQQLSVDGSEVLATGLVAWGVVSWLQWAAHGALGRQDQGWYLKIVILGQLAVAALVLTGVATLWRGADGLYWLGPSIALCYMAAIAETWALFGTINRLPQSGQEQMGSPAPLPEGYVQLE